MSDLKKELRHEVLYKRDQLTADDITAKSKAITAKFLELEEFQKAGVIMFFIAYRNEVDTRPLIEKSLSLGKTVVVPRTLKDTKELIPSRLIDWEKDLAPGAYGIKEPLPERTRPVEPKEIDLLLIPGVAFDLSGNRLGYGGGYYDRFVGNLRPGTPSFAVAFELQVVDEVPVKEWDHRIDALITEKRVVYFNSRGAES